MSTIPLTLIQGSLALPRLRPLAQLPAPFGHDWSLLPPAYSVRVELKALYAALLRTFCLSDQAIRSLCRWLPPSAGEPPETVIREAVAFESPHPVAAPMPVTEMSAERLASPAAGSGTLRGSPAWAGVAGGFCALSGAAVLAWIAAGHLPHRHADRQANVANGSGMAKVAEVASASAATREMATPSRRATDPVPAAAAVTIASAASPEPSHDIQRARPAATRPSTKTHQHARRAHHANFNGKPAPRHSAAADTLSRSTPASRVPHEAPHPSIAGSYSPLAPSRLGVAEYNAVTLSAATPVGHIATLPRPAGAATAPVTSATEWSTRLSQRRVTEVPDQFAR
ncbi:hypothetical protein AAGS40_10990 [Paraburkholderia sp. PREW-6R]|uniref:hypothetical protein n=1 Tax=Paraburkholderia sp. PREW-6R TaxID=3141544 RepID=UPI0031F5A98D